MYYRIDPAAGSIRRVGENVLHHHKAYLYTNHGTFPLCFSLPLNVAADNVAAAFAFR